MLARVKLALLLCICCLSAVPAARFHFSDFKDRLHLVVNGDADTSKTACLRLTDGPAQTSSAFFSTPVNLDNAFFTTFSFRISNDSAPPPPLTGGDGFAFVLQAQGASALGQPGSQIGFGGLQHALAVEFDTKLDARDERDPTWNHLSLHVALDKGSRLSAFESSEPHIASRLPVSLRSGQRVTAQITLLDKTLRVFLRDPLKPVLEVPLPSNVKGSFHVGFTAATNAQSNDQQEICEWAFAQSRNTRTSKEKCFDGFSGADCSCASALFRNGAFELTSVLYSGYKSCAA